MTGTPIHTPGLIVAAPRSGAGKTTLTLGLLRAFARRGLKVSGAKCGPDYIDPAFHAAASGAPSLNLDSWAMPPRLVAHYAARTGAGRDLVIGEGLMGLFDGVPAPAGRSGSSADVAAATGWPILLVLDVSGQSQSAAAVAKGCMLYDPRIKIAGIVLNRTGSERHVRLVRDAVEALPLSVVGALPRSAAIALPERHLGLVQAGETAGLEKILDAMANLVEANVDLDALRALAQPLRMSRAGAAIAVPPPGGVPPPGRRIALAQDAAFSFIYPHIIAGWRAAGAEIVPFSPLADEPPPQDCDICWLPGGYPELHAGALAGAEKFLRGLRRFAETRAVHGECGGYMVLGRGLTGASGARHAMADLLSVETSFATRKMNLGYRTVELVADCALGEKGARYRGHEFHYSSVVSLGADAPFALSGDAYGNSPAAAGSRRGRVSGSFFHVIAGA